jgi:hypothetical protein
LTFIWQERDGLAFLPVLDLTNGIHLLRILCPDDPPEAAELLDYFDSTYISGRLRLCQVVETALVVDVATKYSCNCTKNCIFKVWTLKCRLLAWQFKQQTGRVPCKYGQNAENRMLVFYSPESLKRLANAQTFFIFMDGAFSRSGWVCLWCWLPGLSWHFWFLST